jgi:hypothetical protein
VSRKKESHPRWRPDFRIQSTLPDIKVVRTGFIINFVVIACVAFALFSVLQSEYQTYTLRNEISVLEERTQAAKAADESSLKQSERFRAAALNVQELQRFYKAPFTAHDLIAELAMLRPDDLIYTRVEFADSVVTVKVKAKGNEPAKETKHMEYNVDIAGDVRDLVVLTEFKASLQASELLSPEGFSVVVNESVQQRNAQTGIIPFKVTILFQPEKASKTKGSKK